MTLDSIEKMKYKQFFSLLDNHPRITRTHYMFPPNEEDGDTISMRKLEETPSLYINSEALQFLSVKCLMGPLFTRRCFVNIPTPSNSQHVINFNAHREKLLRDRPNALKGITFSILKPLIFGVIRIAIQLLRPFLAIYFTTTPIILYLLSQTDYISNLVIDVTDGVVNLSFLENIIGLVFSYTIPICVIHFIIDIFVLLSLFEDVNFKRAYCGYKTKVSEGFYYNKNSQYAPAVETHCRSISDPNGYQCTPYLIHGDFGTLIPLTYDPALIDFERRYVRTMDHESIALDFKFPEEGIDFDKPFYLCLHGLNGGSNEPYILDFVHRAVAKGFGTASLIARGMMGMPVTRGKVFNGSRYEDLALCIRILRQTYGPKLKIIIVGMSMGGMISALYLSRIGKEAGVRGAIVFSATADIAYHPLNARSRLLWQAPITFTLKVNLLLPSQPWLHTKPVDNVLHDVTKEYITQSRSQRIRAKTQSSRKNMHLNSTIESLELETNISPSDLDNDSLDDVLLVDLKKAQESSCMVEFDNSYSAPSFGYKNAYEYYRACSPCENNGLENIDVPILFINAADDPVVGIDSLAPAIEATKTNPNIFVRVTNYGGHVGWPTGMKPGTVENMFSWNHKAAFEFADTILETQRLNGFVDQEIIIHENDFDEAPDFQEEINRSNSNCSNRNYVKEETEEGNDDNQVLARPSRRSRSRTRYEGN